MGQPQQPQHELVPVTADQQGAGAGNGDDGSQVVHYVLHVHMPKINSAADAVVDIGPKQVKVTAPGLYKLTVRGAQGITHELA